MFISANKSFILSIFLIKSKVTLSFLTTSTFFSKNKELRKKSSLRSPDNKFVVNVLYNSFYLYYYHDYYYRDKKIRFLRAKDTYSFTKSITTYDTCHPF